ncbi:m-AAA protease-interacting protein 1, mitochondrial-like [Pollicipes pollicipes]|uniref:m-AAA protease-interacting protein 1, mitochondrial-like n=1 Tax=Pollicipes pollicipes TaxID=41117 RepID=UPI0018851CA8|nr:m-AAA protease-interacting protein 1, mitochondrial-like [Pollicipes pollicipes]XP_037082743.1 m-AAA protease-interacting protein 1, mitochondrial-like [Pollicipes pollicipes]
MSCMTQISVLGARSAQLALLTLKGSESLLQKAKATSAVLHLAGIGCNGNRGQLHTMCRPKVTQAQTLTASGPIQSRLAMSSDMAGSRDLMDFPHIVFPSFVKMAKNVFLQLFVIRPYLDQSFSFPTFLDGAKQALLVVSEKLANGDFAGLRGLVTPEALAEIERNYATLSVKERCDLKVIRDNIGPIFPYEIGMIIEEDDDIQKRWVEVTVCAHVHSNFANRDRLSESEYVPPYQLPDFTVWNYRFIRNYTKGVNDSWVVNVVNHFKPNVEQAD